MSDYDFVVVGCGMFGATFAQQAAERDKTTSLGRKNIKKDRFALAKET